MIIIAIVPVSMAIVVYNPFPQPHKRNLGSIYTLWNMLRTPIGGISHIGDAPKSKAGFCSLHLAIVRININPSWHSDVCQLNHHESILIGGLEHVLFSPIAGMMIQPDELIFFRGVGIPPMRL